MCVRPACYLPTSEPTPREHAESLIARRNAGAVVELAALAAFLCALLIWSSILSGHAAGAV